MLKQLYLLATGFAEALSAVVWVTPPLQGHSPDQAQALQSTSTRQRRGLYHWSRSMRQTASPPMLFINTEQLSQAGL